MRELLEQFVARACEGDPSSAPVLEIELLSGCANCGRRLLEAGQLVRGGTVAVDVRDELTDETLAKYAVCSNCVRETAK